MTIAEMVLEKLRQLPPDQQKVVLDFVESLEETRVRQAQDKKGVSPDVSGSPEMLKATTEQMSRPPRRVFDFGKPQPVPNAEGVFDYPIMESGNRVGHARIALLNDGTAEVRRIYLGDRTSGIFFDIRALMHRFSEDHPRVTDPGSLSQIVRVDLSKLDSNELSSPKGSRKALRSLEGLWEDFGIEITEKDIAEARREMWSNFPREIS